MTHEAVGAHLEQGGDVLAPCPFDGALGGLAHGHHVLTIHHFVGHVVRAGALGDVVDGRGALERRAHPVAVVLDHVDDGKLPERGHVERLVEGAAVHRSLAEEAEAHLVAAAILHGEAHAGGERDVPAHDAVAAEEVDVAIEEVHGAALTLGAAVGAPEELRHYRSRRHAARQRLAVLPIGAQHVVVFAERRDGAHAHRFLTDVQVAEATDLSERVRLGGALLEATDEEHLPEELAA